MLAFGAWSWSGKPVRAGGVAYVTDPPTWVAHGERLVDDGRRQFPPADIAQSVGLTERTFFRHFSDKREVLFYGQQQFLQAFVDGVDAAPPTHPRSSSSPPRFTRRHRFSPTSAARTPARGSP
jgi:hypothetical protein